MKGSGAATFKHSKHLCGSNGSWVSTMFLAFQCQVQAEQTIPSSVLDCCLYNPLRCRATQSRQPTHLEDAPLAVYPIHGPLRRPRFQCLGELILTECLLRKFTIRQARSMPLQQLALPPWRFGWTGTLPGYHYLLNSLSWWHFCLYIYTNTLCTENGLDACVTLLIIGKKRFCSAARQLCYMNWTWSRWNTSSKCLLEEFTILVWSE